MTPATSISSPRELRLMPFGQTEARHVRDGLWEPLWGGRRALIEVLSGVVMIRDENDEELSGFEPLRSAVLESVQAEELVLDGYLLPAPLRDTAGAESPAGMDAVMTPGEVGRQMILGSGNPERREARLATSAPRPALAAASPTAFVAVDLLWLDGEPIIDVPLLERKRLLEAVVIDGDVVRRTVSVRAPVEPWYGQWRALGFSQVAVKAANSRYTPGRPNGEWATAVIPRR